jgi:integrase
MPRKPKLDKKTITVVVNSTPITVTLHPPTGARKAWYAYWGGLVSSRSTGQSELAKAIVAAENMVKNGGRQAQLEDVVLSDEEFQTIQRVHYARKKDPDAQRRSAKSLKDCLGAIEAFKGISGLERVASANPADCGQFQQRALVMSRNWRHHHARSDAHEKISPNTVLKWSRQMMAAFERVNRNAGKKCVRDVIADEKLLESNPWSRFSWLVEGIERPVRQFDPEELLSLLDFIETRWGGVPAEAAAFKTLLWTAIRREELATLSWNATHVVEGEHHFDVVGKRGVRRWLRLPDLLYHDLMKMRNASAFVFAAYTEQLQQHYRENPNVYQNIRFEYKPANFEHWLYRRVKEWAATNPKGDAYVHIFRKTGLQHAREGADINREVAADASVSTSVLTTHYITQSEAQLRAGSNRTFRRILASLPTEVAYRYGYEEAATPGLEEQLQAAVATKNWSLVREVSGNLAKEVRSEAG